MLFCKRLAVGQPAANYKGIYADQGKDKHYVNPQTGAHFDFPDMVDRLKMIGVKRMQYLQTLARQDQEFNLLGVPTE